MPLPTDRNPGDPIQSADIDAIAEQVNTNETDIADRVTLDGSNFTDGGAALLAALALSAVAKCLTPGVELGFWVQAADPVTTDPGTVADGQLWIAPAGS